MSHLARIQPECLQAVVDYLGTETFQIYEDERGEYVRIGQRRWQWMQERLAEAMFGGPLEQAERARELCGMEQDGAE